MKKSVVICLVAGLAVTAPLSPCRACLWDSDTLRTEAAGLPGVAEILTGRFERQPPLYYEMRLTRVTGVLASSPDDLDAYDDAAVACDRLGRSGEGIDWLVKKKAALDRLTAAGAPTGDHLYRYHANLGTLLAHRWLGSGADRTKMDDMIAGRDHIAEAIRINPDAHFGREKYQLMAMEWIITPPKSDDEPWEMTSIFDVGDVGTGTHELRANPRPDAVKGLTGLIALGNAWESVDIFYALALVLSHQQHFAMADLARRRFEELIDQGKGSLHSAMPRGDALKELTSNIGYESENRSQIGPYFVRARREADRWHEQRTAFMVERLKAGRHPDTDAEFWDGYSELPPPPLPNGFFGLSRMETLAVQVGAVGVGGAMVLVGAGVALRRRRRRRLAAASSTPAA